MGQCLKCGKKVGFFSTRDVGVITPLCSNCAKELRKEVVPLIVMLLISDRSELENEPKTMGRIAALHLLCAERVNIVRRLKSAETGLLEDYHTWYLSKDASIKFCRKALEKKIDDPNANIFLQTLLLQAESLSASQAPELVDTNIIFLRASDSLTFTRPEHQAAFSGVVTMKDFEEFIKSIPGNQWLEE